MLYLETIYPDTLGLLKELMGREELYPFSLAGGTALALQIGHRISVDLDFFSSHSFDPEELFTTYNAVGSYQLLSQSKNILVVSLNGVKVDVVNYRYKLLNPLKVIEGIRLFSIPDIAAMKLAAITGRGRKRDFVDMYFLLASYSLSEMLAFYREKFPDGSDFLVTKSLVYFEDAEEDEAPQLLKQVKWSDIKARIQAEVRDLF